MFRVRVVWLPGSSHTVRARRKNEFVINNNKKNSMIVTYPQSGHDFFTDYRSSYNGKDAWSGWSELIAWFRKHEILE